MNLQNDKICPRCQADFQSPFDFCDDCREEEYAASEEMLAEYYDGFMEPTAIVPKALQNRLERWDREAREDMILEHQKAQGKLQCQNQ